MEIVKKILTKNPCYTAGRTITVKGLMLHSVGCPQPSAQAFIKNWNSPSYDRACVHGFIDANNGKIYQTLPWNRRGWHAGGAANNTHIGIEMCEPSQIKYTSGSSFTCKDKAAAKAAAKRTYNSAVQLFAYLCKEYKLNPDKYKGHVGDVSMVIRISLTTKSMTPNLYDIMRLLGKKRILNRIKELEKNI